MMLQNVSPRKWSIIMYVYTIEPTPADTGPYEYVAMGLLPDM